MSPRRRQTLWAGVCAAVCVIGAGGFAPPALAGWSPAQTVEPGADPAIAFAPTGVAAIASQLSDHGRSEAGLVVSRDARGGFGRPHLTGSVGPSDSPLGIAPVVASDGTAVVAFESPTRQGDGVRALVLPALAARFGPVQRLLPDSSAGGYGGAAFVSTTRGEIVEFGFDQSRSQVATLAPGSTRFADRTVDLDPSEQFGGLVTDARGDTLLTDMNAGSCTVVDARARSARFARRSPRVAAAASPRSPSASMPPGTATTRC